MVGGNQAIHGPHQLTLTHSLLNLILRLGVPAVATLDLEAVHAPLQLKEAQLTPEGA